MVPRTNLGTARSPVFDGVTVNHMRLKKPETPEPLEDWGPVEPFTKRLVKAVSIPITAGAVVLAFGVLISIAMLWLAPSQSIGVTETTPLSGPAHSGPVSESDSRAQGSSSTEEIEEVSRIAADAAHDHPLVTVHVVGEVQEPGVFVLREGDRVEAAINAAGGPTENAALEGINLARQLSDGEQLLIPTPEQVEELPGELATGAAGDTRESAQSTLVNINSAQAADLERLPGIGPALAERIITFRESNGPFREPTDLLEVSGIGAKKFEMLRDSIRVN